MPSKRDQQLWGLGGRNAGNYDFSVSGIAATPYNVRASADYQTSYGDYIRSLLAEMRQSASDPLWDHRDAKNWRF